MLILTWLLIFHVNHDSCLFRLESIFALTKGKYLFDLILRYGAFSPAKIIYKGFTRYGNACILIELIQESHEIVPFVSLRTLDGQMIIQN